MSKNYLARRDSKHEQAVKTDSPLVNLCDCLAGYAVPHNDTWVLAYLQSQSLKEMLFRHHVYKELLFLEMAQKAAALHGIRAPG